MGQPSGRLTDGVRCRSSAVVMRLRKRLLGVVVHQIVALHIVDQQRLLVQPLKLESKRFAHCSYARFLCGGNSESFLLYILETFVVEQSEARLMWSYSGFDSGEKHVCERD